MTEPPSDAKQVIVAKAVAALEVIARYAGEHGEWSRRAQLSYANQGDNHSLESGARSLSTDVMGQVRRLLEDRDGHPAAAIMLCGSALEVALRAAVEVHDLDVTANPASATTVVPATNSSARHARQP